METPADHIKKISNNIESLSASLENWNFEFFDKNFEKSKDNYRLIKSKVLNRYETRRFIIKYLQNSGMRLANHYMIMDIIRTAWTSALSELSTLKQLDTDRFASMKRKYFLEKGKSLYQKGRVDEALDIWEAVLKTEPNNKYIHSQLDEIIRSCGN